MNKTQVITWLLVPIFSWYGMMVVHEVGHCLGALVTGASVETLDIPLLGFSRTDFSGGTNPLLVVWAGPLLGAFMPAVALLALLGFVGPRVKQAMVFFVGFCLLTNGAYIGLGAFSQAGDCRRLLQYGSPMWLLVAFGIVSSGCGLYAWHQLGPLKEWFATNEKT